MPSPTVDHKTPAANTNATPYLWASALGVGDARDVISALTIRFRLHDSLSESSHILHMRHASHVINHGHTGSNETNPEASGSPRAAFQYATRQCYHPRRRSVTATSGRFGARNVAAIQANCFMPCSGRCAFPVRGRASRLPTRNARALALSHPSTPSIAVSPCPPRSTRLPQRPSGSIRTGEEQRSPRR